MKKIFTKAYLPHRIIGILSVGLIVSLGFNYWLFGKYVAYNKHMDLMEGALDESVQRLELLGRMNSKAVKEFQVKAAKIMERVNSQ